MALEEMWDALLEMGVYEQTLTYVNNTFFKPSFSEEEHLLE